MIRYVLLVAFAFSSMAHAGQPPGKGKPDKPDGAELAGYIGSTGSAFVNGNKTLVPVFDSLTGAYWSILETDGDTSTLVPVAGDGHSVPSIPQWGFGCRLPAICDNNGTLVIAGQKPQSYRDGIVQVREYERIGRRKKTQWEESHRWTAATVRSWVLSMIELESGGLVLCWHEEAPPEVHEFRLHFEYRTPDGEWGEPTAATIQQTGYYWARADMAQMPSGDVWCIAKRDSNCVLHSVVLKEAGSGLSAVSQEDRFIEPNDANMVPDGELPYLSMAEFGDGVVVAYQSMDRVYWSSDPLRKGCKINVVKINQDGTRSLLYRTAQYAERVAPLVALPDASVIFAAVDGSDGNDLNVELLSQVFPNGVIRSVGVVRTRNWRASPLCIVGNSLVEDACVSVFGISAN